MREDMGEKQPARLQPTGDVSEEQRVIFKVLEHLDRHDAVELARGDIEQIDVARDDPEIGEAALTDFGVDVLLLST
jgi:hypothetical protein